MQSQALSSHSSLTFPLNLPPPPTPTPLRCHTIHSLYFEGYTQLLQDKNENRLRAAFLSAIGLCWFHFHRLSGRDRLLNFALTGPSNYFLHSMLRVTVTLQIKDFNFSLFLLPIGSSQLFFLKNVFLPADKMKYPLWRGMRKKCTYSQEKNMGQM